MSRVGTRSLLFALDSGSGYVDCTDAVSRVVLTPRQRPGGRFLGEASYEYGGERSYALALTLAQDTSPDSLWSLVAPDSNVAGRPVSFHLAPHGNWTASVDEPHWTGQAFLNGPDTVLGGEASTSRRAVLTSEMVWPVDRAPIRVTTGPYPADLPEGW